MTAVVITDEFKTDLEHFLKKERNPELITAYLFFVEKRFHVHPVAFPQAKMIYQGAEEAVKVLELEGKLWHEAEVTINYDKQSVNDQTKKIYICPFSGKVFGDNTHPNPQDAIYDWVSHCPQNTERAGGLRVKRFFVSEDPEMIKNYITKRKDPIKKVVYSSVITGKLFNSKGSVIEDFKKNYLKHLTLVEVQNQNRFNIEEHFLDFIQKQLEENKIAAFIEALSEHKEFQNYIEKWLEANSE